LKFMIKNRTLALKFTIMLLAILLIGQAFFIHFIMSVRGNLVDSLNEKINQTGNLLARIILRPVLDNDKELMNAYLEDFLKDEDVVSIALFDKAENLLGKKVRPMQKSSNLNLFFVKPFLKHKIPVLSGNEKIAHINVTFSSGKINDRLFEHSVFAVMYQGVLLIIVVLLILSFNRNVKKPLLELRAALRRAGEGDLAVTIQPTGNLEIDELINGFGALISRLKKTLQKLHTTTNDVTAAIRQINLIINKVKEGTHNQANATAEVIMAMEGSDKYQKDILDNAQNLGEFSDENLTSLMEINVTSEEIKNNSEELLRSSSATLSTVAEMSAAAKAIAQSTDELSASTEEIAVSIEQISANTKQVESSTNESSALTNKVRDIASGSGMLTVADAMGGMDEIISSVDKTLSLVMSLQTKSRDAEKVLTVIADVTKQTNLLSVNAAILAAQAGEYGKGFSVVADEIKMLADRTAASSKEIIKIIKSIQKGISETTRVTENSKRIVENGNSLVVKTGEAFREVINSAQKSSEMADSIQGSTKEQLKGIMQINDSMEMIRIVVEQVVRATHEHDIGSDHLLNVAEKVKEMSEGIKRSMLEQTSGISLISKNLELTNERINNISSATSKHSQANELIMTAASTIGTICNETLTIAEEISVSFDTLYQEAETLKKDMEEF